MGGRDYSAVVMVGAVVVGRRGCVGEGAWGEAVTAEGISVAGGGQKFVRRKIAWQMEAEVGACERRVWLRPGWSACYNYLFALETGGRGKGVAQRRVV